MTSRLRGTVKWFNDAKGFGFINHESGKDVFVHYSVIQSEGFKTLKDGELVDYELTEGAKGLHAGNVTRVSSDSGDNAALTAPTSQPNSASKPSPLRSKIELTHTDSAASDSLEQELNISETKIREFTSNSSEESMSASDASLDEQKDYVM